MSSAAGSAAVASGPALGEGQPWGAYRIGRLLGRGGMGEVYEAEHAESGRRVALKVLRSRLQTSAERARFLREGQLAASVSHPHTVYIFGSEEISGMPVISMELLPGGTLKDRVAGEGPLPPGEAVAAVLDIIGGLDAAHADGILHRDIKPSNCFVDRDGTVKVGDFGLSVSTLARDVRHELATAGFEGTPQFAPPEQLRGEPLDVRADIYAVGATLYYLLTGRPPFDAPDLRELFARVTTGTPPSPRELRPEIPPRLAAVVMQCLARAPSDRPASYAALAEALRPFLARADMPARLGIRFVAGLVDVAILSLPLALASMWLVDPATQTVEYSLTVGIWSSLASLIYFFLLEGFTGASLGKRLFKLRVAAPAGSAASLGGIAVRVAIYFLVPVLLTLALWTSGAVSAETLNYARGPIGLLVMAVLFSTVRRRNGWAAIHDLVSGTRVLEPAGFHAKRVAGPAANPAEAAHAPADGRRRYGPFTVVGDAGTVGDGRLLVGFDPVLRRQVWIHVVAPGVPAVSGVRRDVSRIGRLHWLTGRRSRDENWDAYEAPDGRPLALTGSAATWPSVKLWLLDLAGELGAAAREGSLPQLRLDRLWLRPDGHMVLLDFPAPRGEVAGNADTDLTAVALLAAVGTSALAGMAHGAGPAAMPLSAQRLIEQWRSATPPTLAAAAASLRDVARGEDEVRRWRRALPIVLGSMPAVIVVVAAALMLPYFYRFMTDARNVEILSGLGMLQNPNARDPRLRDPEVRTAIERYLVGKYSGPLGDDAFWNTLMMRQLGAVRPTARAILARHPQVSAEELARATQTIAPERARWARDSNVQVRGLIFVGGIIVSTLTALGIAFVLVVSLVSAALVPGGVMTRALGYAVVRKNGSEIGRGRSLLRAAVVWSPALVWLGYLAMSPRIQGYVPAPPMPWVGVGLTLALLAAGAVWTIVRPTRGPHDRLLGTWVVPR
jgi:uncharacterized RDD family membrane protein YckC